MGPPTTLRRNFIILHHCLLINREMYFVILDPTGQPPLCFGLHSTPQETDPNTELLLLSNEMHVPDVYSLLFKKPKKQREERKRRKKRKAFTWAGYYRKGF